MFFAAFSDGVRVIKSTAELVGVGPCYSDSFLGLCNAFATNVKQLLLITRIF